jgi:hypothetical protein
MTHAERIALREKHSMTVDYDGDNFCGYCVCFYPCDVLKVLDWYERREEMEIAMALSNLRDVFKTYPLIGIQNAIYALEGKL